MARIYGAYVVHGAEPFGPILFFADLKSPLSLVWAACYVFEAFITDSLTVRLPANPRLSSLMVGRSPRRSTVCTSFGEATSGYAFPPACASAPCLVCLL